MKNLHVLLQRLADAGLEFVVVGGFAGVLHGSAYVTGRALGSGWGCPDLTDGGPPTSEYSTWPRGSILWYCFSVSFDELDLGHSDGFDGVIAPEKDQRIADQNHFIGATGIIRLAKLALHERLTAQAG